jgi:hypothetical protein
MLALFLFHLRVGVRVALRASPPLFCGIVAAVMFQDPPGAMVAAMARAAFAAHLAPAAVIPVAAIAFLLSAWGRQRLSEGLNGWIRHLPVSQIAHRGGFFLGLLTVQLPLFLMLALLALTAKRLGLAVAPASVRWCLVCMATAAVNTSFQTRKSTIWRKSGVLLGWQITRRAIGSRILRGLLQGAVCIGMSRLFILNNQLTGSNATAAARLGGVAGCAFCLSSLSNQIGKRRPIWPLARSFPCSSMARVVEDALFAGICLLPLLALVASRNLDAALVVLIVAPSLCVRAAEYTRRVPEERVAALVFLAEGLGLAVLVTLLPWSAAIAAIAVIPALYSARNYERNRKATVWLELHHASVGDSSSWSA